MLSFTKTLKLCKKTPQSSPKFVHRDELSYDNKENPRFFRVKKNKRDDRLQQPLPDQIKGAGVDEIKAVDQKDVNLRVKIRMTREEAGRLLAKCKDQRGTLEFKDVAHELVKIPAHRVVEVSSMASGKTRRGPVLPTIEE